MAEKNVGRGARFPKARPSTPTTPPVQQGPRQKRFANGVEGVYQSSPEQLAASDARFAASQVARVWRARPLSSDTSDALQSLQDAYETIGVDPVLANQIAGSTWGLLASPEIIMGLRSEFSLEGSRVAEYILDDLTNGQIRDGAAQRFEQDMVDDGGLTAL